MSDGHTEAHKRMRALAGIDRLRANMESCPQLAEDVAILVATQQAELKELRDHLQNVIDCIHNTRGPQAYEAVEAARAILAKQDAECGAMWLKRAETSRPTLPPVPAGFASWEDALVSMGVTVYPDTSIESNDEVPIWHIARHKVTVKNKFSLEIEYPTYPQAIAAAVRHYTEQDDE